MMDPGETLAPGHAKPPPASLRGGWENSGRMTRREAKSFKNTNDGIRNSVRIKKEG